MSPRTVVFLAYYFPPLVGIASDRAQSLAENLQQLGWEPVVITVGDGHYHRVAESPVMPFPVVRTRSFEISRALRRAYSRGSQPAEELTIRPLQPGRPGARLRKIVREFLYVPDAQVGWIPFAAGAALRAVPTGRDAVVLSTSVPYSAHLAAMRVAAKSGLGWVAEFRDPWSTAHAFNLPATRLRRRVDRALERWILRRADHVIVTSHCTRERLLARHPGLAPDRITTVTNGFVPAPDGSPPVAQRPLSILYAGIVAPGEQTADLMTVLERVDRQEPGSFELHVLGPSDRWLENGASPSAWLRLDGIVSPPLARQAMADSSALLLIQRHAAYRAILPGKVFEYIGARRPIIAAVNGDSELASLLREHADVRFVAPDEPQRLQETVLKLITEHRAGALAGPRVPASVTAPLQRKRQAEQLAEIFERVVRDRAAGRAPA